MRRFFSFLILILALSGMLVAQQPPAGGPAAPAAPSTTLNTTMLLTGPGAQPPAISRLASLSPMASAPDWTELLPLAKRLTRQEVERALTSIYTSTGTPFTPPWRLEGNALFIQTGSMQQPEEKLELAARAEPWGSANRYWHRATELPLLKAGEPVLKGLHIALDPGHIGGAYARMEERHLSFQPGEAIQEGDLTLLAAQVLKERLQALGAYVSLVRDRTEPVTKQRPAELRDVARKVLKESGFAEPVESYEGINGDAKLLTVQWQSEKLFYRVSEIRARAKRVNQEIKPDLVICLHLNAEAWGAAEAPQFSPKNHFHVLVNGCFIGGELEQADVRYEMFQRLFQRIHEEEIPLADSVAQGLGDSTGLQPYVYTTPNARRAGQHPAVFARNLLASRLYQCPVIYLEPFVMNHEETYRRLLLGHYLGRTLSGGRLVPSAIEDYVRGVTQGLVSYYQKHRLAP
jgi:N-acetylmuramoyl-L-alanine amidase